MNGTFVRANGVDLCVETFGTAGDPAILLIGGGASSMDWWEDEFCARLAAGLRFVVRYDSRDTGRSTSYEVGAPPYTTLDLAADAMGLLDAIGLRRAHLVGMSTGAEIAQRLAVEHSDRVGSLTLIAASPGGPGGPRAADLPAESDRLSAYFAADIPPPDWTDRVAVIDYILDGARAFAGSRGVDEAHLRQLVGRVFDRTPDMAASVVNHALIEGGGEPVRPRLGRVTAPTLVIHGTEDPFLPYGHAEALANEIPDARLLPLDGVGHEMPPVAVWDAVVPAILRLTSGGWEEQGERLVSMSFAAGDPTGWFDRLYAAGAAGELDMPWARTYPHPLLTEWAQARALTGTGQRAVVVGCGLGADAEYVAGLGYDTMAFDIADTAVQLARQRFPDSVVQYVTADLLEPPVHWSMAFDLVVEIITVQALPNPQRQTAIGNVGRLVAPGGTLIVIAAARNEGDVPAETPPWPLTRSEIESFVNDGIAVARIEDVVDPRRPTERRWRAEFHRE
jgi:pimeloyl-ACP methyl ester carboxylesterase/SAM-dependent methyltransferase